MASIFGHGVLAYTLTNCMCSKSTKLLVGLAILSSILPDLDVLAFRFGIPYTHMLGHRGFTHSILFAVLWAIIIALIFGKSRKWLYVGVIFLATVSHGVLDAMTSGGKGVGFFIPFTPERYFFGFRKIQVSPIYIDKFFSEWGVRVILSEIKYIVLPCLVMLIVLKLTKLLQNEHKKRATDR